MLDARSHLRRGMSTRATSGRLSSRQNMFLDSKSHLASVNESYNTLAWRNLRPEAGIRWEIFFGGMMSFPT